MPLAWLRSVLERALREEADLIVLTGDYVHARDTRHELDAIWPELLSLKAPHGVRMVLGNHDHWADADHGLALLRESGLSLRHRVETITVGDGRLLPAGTGDHWEDEALVDETLAGWDPELPRIVLAHNPDTADGGYHERAVLPVRFDCPPEIAALHLRCA